MLQLATNEHWRTDSQHQRSVNSTLREMQEFLLFFPARKCTDHHAALIRVIEHILRKNKTEETNEIGKCEQEEKNLASRSLQKTNALKCSYSKLGVVFVALVMVSLDFSIGVHFPSSIED